MRKNRFRLFNKARNERYDENPVCMTLTARFGTGGGNTPLVLAENKFYAMQRIGEYKESKAASALKQRDYKDATDLVLRGCNTLSVRRLTPLEAERLQKIPDNWTNIGAWTDGNGKVHKECSDSKRYQAIGNAIATPMWKVVLKRISAQYDRDATLGSCFDGISCFPYLWEQINGKGSAVWCSEIDDFCTAISKYHFPDENEGKTK